MTNRIIRCWVLLTALVLVCGGTQAATIFQQTLRDDLPGVISDLDHVLPTQLLDDFTAGATTSIVGLEWYGGPATNGDVDPLFNSSFLVRFYADVSGSPSSTSFFENTVTASPVEIIETGVRTQYRYVTNISGPSVVMGETYYLSIVETDPLSSLSGEVVWGWANGNNNATLGSYFWDSNSASWSQSSFLLDKDFAFTLNSEAFTIPPPITLPMPPAVPIPSAVWLFGSAVGLLGWIRNKRS